jgi:hypothetical protein
MQANVFKLTQWICAAALLVSGCAYEHPGPKLPPGQETVTYTDDSSAPTAPAPSGKKSATNESGRPGASTATVSTAPATGAEPVQTTLPVAAPPNPGVDATAGLYPESSAASLDADSSFDNLEVIDDSLKTKLTILRVGSQPTANNLLSVFAGLKNKTSRSLFLEVQTIYKDKTGASLNDGSWIPLTLKPHEEAEYHSASISPDAVDFLVRVRRAQPDPDGSQ